MDGLSRLPGWRNHTTPPSPAPQSADTSGGTGKIVDIPVPSGGESVTEAGVGEWFKKVGDAVAVDEALVELETDKAAQEVMSPVAGVVKEIVAETGDTVEVGAILARIEEGGTASATPPAKTEEPKGKSQGDGNMPPSPAAQKILAEKGIDANKVTISERPYLSVEPAIVQQKASQLVADIPTLEVNLQSDSLLLSGQLSSQQWLALNQSLQKIPGIDALTIDCRALKISANQSLDVVQREALIQHYRNRITQFAVTFEVDASQLNATQRAYLGDLAQDILALQAILSDTGSAPKILIIGSSDQTGVASKNKALSAVRAEAVKRALVEQGVPSASLIATGIGELPIDNQSGRMVLFTLFPQSLLGAEDVEQ